MKVNSILCTGFFCTAVLLVGCGTQGNTGVTTPPAQNNTNAESNTSTIGTSTATSNQIVVTNSTTTGSQSPSQPVGHTVKMDILQSMQLAKQGRVIGVPYAADKSLIDQVSHDWGTTSHESSAGAGIYDTYQGKYAAFGFNKGGQIFDVRSYHPELRKIRFSDVISTLGQPGDVRYYNGQTILLYTAGPKFQLLWIFPNKSASNANPYLDHVSVFCPQDTVNIMAATQPAPAIVVDEEPGATGSLFTFSIMQEPNGYKLSELEWIGSNGHAVVNTSREAIQHGASGGNVPGFQISGDGSTIGFDYPTAMVGEQGSVVVIFQAPSGQAMIGQSDKLTLK